MNTLHFIQNRSILLVFLLIYQTGSFLISFNQIYAKNIAISTSHNVEPSSSFWYEKHDSLKISGTADFKVIAETENWGGDGSSSNPYVIERLGIAGSGNLISICHTDLYFLINNCFLTGLYPSSLGCGILLSNVSNGYISNNVIENIDGVGILIEMSSNIAIIDTSIQRNNGEGIWIGESNNIDIIGNTIVENGLVGIDLYKSNLINITLNQIRSNKYFGVRLRHSNHNLLFRISISNNTDYGIQFESSNYNNITWNIFIRNKLDGSSQAYDDGIGNSFADNFWYEWIRPDGNNDGIVDSPYEIDGSSNNRDIFPHISIIKTICMIRSTDDNRNNNLLFKPKTNTVFGVFFLAIILSLLGIVIMKQKK